MILLYDTTLRDGAQGEGVSLSLEDKLLIAKRLDRFGIPYIEGGWPGSNPKDLAFFKKILETSIERARIVAFGSTRRANQKVQEDSNVTALLEAGTKTVTIFGKSWDFQVKEVFRTSLEENLRMIRETVSYLKEKGLEVIYDAEHFFDGFKANPEYALKTLREAARAGADNLTLCDTNGGSLPTEVTKAILQVKKELKVPLGIHCHNDCNLAVANSIAAVEGGCVLVQGTMNGYGERCGNANLTSIIPVLELKLNRRCLPSPTSLLDLTPVSHYVSEICNMPMELNQPFTGRSAFAHKGGVHIDAVMKNVKTYEHIDPEKVGNRRRFLSSELGGRTSLLLKAKELNIDLKKDSPETRKILGEVQKREGEGYQYEAAEASFQLLIQRALGTKKEFFKTKDVMVSSEKIGDDNPLAEARVTAMVGNKIETKVAKGDGPVDALYKALKSALVGFYPQINQIHLTDYKVRVVDSQAGTAAKVRVFVTFQDERKDWTTVGVDKNIIEASWKALVEAIEYKLALELKLLKTS